MFMCFVFIVSFAPHLNLSPQIILFQTRSSRQRSNEPKLERGRVYYEKIKDCTRLSLPLVLCFFCLAEAVSILSVVPFHLNIIVSVHLPIFTKLPSRVPYGTCLELLPSCHAQKTINVYCFVYGFGAPNHKGRGGWFALSVAEWGWLG